MPRTARIAPKEFIYHVLTRGNNRQTVFRSDGDFIKYLDILKSAKEKNRFLLYHYVLMSNHVHLVMEPSTAGSNLSAIMKSINLTYARYFQKKFGLIGHFWQDRFKSMVIARDEYLLTCGSYVELNPVRAGIVTDPAHYPWSSYGGNALGKEDPLLDSHPIISGWSPDREARLLQYRNFVGGMLEKKEALRGEMNGRQIYGSEDFRAAVSQQYVVKAEKKRVGRPRKEKSCRERPPQRGDWQKEPGLFDLEKN